MEIIIIAAMARNRIIGKDGIMPWHIPEELRLFKKTTMGYPMIMGRKTFESFPAPLPGRRHIVLSRNKNYNPRGGEYAASMEEALRLCGQAEKVFLIGGADIFQQGFEIATSIRLTLLEREVEGDVTFPDFSDEEFVEVSRQHYPDGSEPFTVAEYRRTVSTA
ncbi:dihydrofolate reductase [Desulfocastanea catecholica]